MKFFSSSSERLVLGISILVLVFLPFFHPTPLIHSSVIIFFFLFHAFLIGRRWFPTRHRLSHPFLGALFLVTSSSIFQTIWYYAGGMLGQMSDAWSLALSLLLLHLLPVPPSPLVEPPVKKHVRWALPLLIAAGIASCFILLYAWRAQTVLSINSPWPLLPAGTFAAFALLAASVWLSAWKMQEVKITLAFSCFFLFTVTMLTTLIYPLGFGFDGFLHRASEQLLFTTGTLIPKPWYYMGQYVFVTWFVRIFAVPLFWVDVLLVPLSALLLPLSFLSRMSKRRSAFLLVGLCLFLPLSLFITTTPQAFSYVIGLLAIFLGIAAFEWQIPWIFVFLLALWSLLIHPLSGLPFLGATITIWSTARKNAVPWILIIGTSILTPVAFFLNGFLSHNGVEWNLGALGRSSFYLDTFTQWLRAPSSHFSLFVDWTNFLHFLLPFLSLIFAIWAIYRDEERRSIWMSLFFLSIGTFLAGIFLRASGAFTFLIEYERGNYANRLFVIASLFLLPVTLQGFFFWMERLRRLSPTIVFSLFLLFVASVSARVYQAFPRQDVAMIGHGWSVGQADLDVVRSIDRDAQGRTYTVLANQSVSAAAVSQYGFKRYVGDVFFYPLPTGGPLYALFLDAMQQPNREVVQEAAELGKSGLVYVVINAYWDDAEQLIEAYKAIADKNWNASQGKIYVFRFDFNVSSKAVK